MVGGRDGSMMVVRIGWGFFPWTGLGSDILHFLYGLRRMTSFPPKLWKPQSSYYYYYCERLFHAMCHAAMCEASPSSPPVQIYCCVSPHVMDS